MYAKPAGSRSSRIVGAMAAAHSRRVNEVVALINEQPTGIVIMATARRAACLLDAFLTLRVLRPDCELVSSKLLDYDPGQLAGREVLLVDDLVASTRTLRTTISKLEAAGARAVRVLAFAIEDGYPFPDDLPLLDKSRTLVLDADSSFALARDLLQVLELCPRPYSLDWPILIGSTPKAELVDSFKSLPGWAFVETTTQLQADERITAITLYPNFLQCPTDLAKAIAIPKVRVWLERTPRGNRIQMMPIVALENSDFRYNTDLALGDLGNEPREALLQHLASQELAECLLSELKLWCNVELKLRQSAQRLRLAFGDELALRLQRCRLGKRLRFDNGVPIVGSWICQPGGPVSRFACLPSVPRAVVTGECDIVLSDLLYRHYAESGEKELRERARRGDRPASAELLDLTWVLRDGLSVRDLETALLAWGYDRQTATSGTSIFLDKAIDSGLVVPVLTGHGRRFRPGETAIFNDRSKRLCEVVLNAVAESRNQRISRLLAQKTLVGLWKFGSETKLLDRFGSDQLVSVQFYTHGAVLAAGARSRVARDGNFVVTSVLETAQVLVSERQQNKRKAGYLVKRRNVFPRVDDRSESSANILGKTINKMLNAVSPPSRSEEEFVLWMSTSDPRQAPIALAADMGLCFEELAEAFRRVLDLFERGGAEAAIYVEKARSTTWHDSLTSGWRKSLWILNGSNKDYEARVRRAFRDDEFAVHFIEQFVDAVHGGNAVTQDADLRFESLAWLLSARLLWSAVTVISSAGRPSLDKRFTDFREHHRHVLAHAGVFQGESAERLRRYLALSESISFDHEIKPDLLRAAVHDLKAWAGGLADRVEVATSSQGTLETYESFGSAMVVRLSRDEDFIGIRSALVRAIGDSGVPATSILEFTAELNLNGVLAFAAKGKDAAENVERLAIALLEDSTLALDRCLVFKSLRSDLAIGRSRQTSMVACSNLARVLPRMLDEFHGCPTFIGTSADLPDRLTSKLRTGTRPEYCVAWQGEDSASRLSLKSYTRASPAQKAPRRSGTRGEVYDEDTVYDALAVGPMPIERTAFFSTFGTSSDSGIFVNNRLGLALFSYQLLSREGKSFRVAYAFPPDKGPDDARDVVARATEAVRYKYLLIHGIAGSLQDTVDIGDVVVGTEVLPYSYRKETIGGTEVVPRQALPLAPESRNLYTALSVKPLSLLRSDGEAASIHLGPVASGDTVLKARDGDVRRYLSTLPIRPLCAEMEAGAVCRELFSRGVDYSSRAIVVRGISDRADRDKDDRHHLLAATNAAQVVRALLDFLPAVDE